MTVPQIAQVLSINEGTVHSRLYYARQKLNQQMKKDLVENFSPDKVSKELPQ